MNRKQHDFEDRKAELAARIAAQRSELEFRITALRKPLQAFGLARSLGQSLRSHAKLFSAAVVFAGLVLMRGKLVSKVGRSVQLARSKSPWYVLAKLAWQMLRRRRSAAEP